MINQWDRGRAEIDHLLKQGRLTRVSANRELAERHLTQAGVHLRAAAMLRDLDPAGAFTLTYDAARLALAALLVNQGLKARGEGAHAVLLEVAIAQLEPPRQREIREFDWMRRLRNETQYPDVDRPSASVDDVDQAIPAARAIVDRVNRLIELMPPY
ncbi:HEPN domain-containing protein [Cryobacterium frigoriphilum]|uniref:HEPN domain-containing protein n=1 Tax=Cryobacterium frigoriphilum TaxID=1259150 RepID=A0A4R8ZTH8_9MICO|nr:HEPN domain-containing protein [Cryobacterium frigoriphilum]TFD44831.1 HEPN domain-containing protein [Cryobacterium frigoriphilum]